MDEPRSVKFLGLLRVLLRHGVDFLVVGGVAAQLEGAPILTLDLDVLYDKSAGNLQRLLAALRELKARYRDPAGRHLEPDQEKLETLRMHLLLTELGALDVLGVIGAGFTYRDLVDRTVSYDLAGTEVRRHRDQGASQSRERSRHASGPTPDAGPEREPRAEARDLS